ncbi:MAG: heme ABC transporter permease [Parvularculaceae bacterium]|jgi:heme exporter protein C|nr:heme ABC transporter permease [Parvularculaceae bacterium]
MSVFDFANPERFERLARPIAVPTGALAAVLIGAGLYYGLFNSPPDYKQGETVRIMYVHVPAAWMALACYTALAAASAVGFIWKHPLADVAARATAPIGAVFTAVAIVTGSLWGRPMWGTWWAWDARLTSVLILFFLYLGYMAVWAAIEDKARAARLAAIVAIAGFINVPIIKFSVDWWNSLHQPASVFRADGPTIDGSMLAPLLLMALGYTVLFIALLLASMRNEIAARRLMRLEGAPGRPVSTVRKE